MTLDITLESAGAQFVVDRQALLCAHHALARVVEEIAEVDITTFETAPAEELGSRLIPLCVELLDRTKEILCEVAPRVLVPRVADVDVSPDSQGRQTLDLDQLCYVARLELCQLEDVLYIQVRGPAEQVLLACDRTLRRTRKAADAVRESLRRLLRLAKVERTDEELAVALVVREEYACFGRAADFDRPSSLGAMSVKIRELRDRLAALMERPGYRLARLKDRLVFRSLRERLSAWLAASPSNLEEGHHLLSDFSATLGMLRLVNQRAELRRYDAVQLEQALQKLKDGAVTSVQLGKLTPLLILEGYLDGRLSDLPGAASAELAGVLEELLRSAKGAAWN